MLKLNINVRFLTLLVGFLIISFNSKQTLAAETYDNLTLKQAIEIALNNNAEKKISYQAAAIAESQYQEALSARWPTLTLQGSFQRRDEAPTFVFPSSSMPLGGLQAPLQAAASLGAQAQAQANGIVDPATLAAIGAGAAAQVPSGISVPEQNVKLFNRDTIIASLKLLYPLYTGGKINSYITQAGLGKEIAHEEM